MTEVLWFRDKTDRDSVQEYCCKGSNNSNHRLVTTTLDSDGVCTHFCRRLTPALSRYLTEILQNPNCRRTIYNTGHLALAMDQHDEVVTARQLISAERVVGLISIQRASMVQQSSEYSWRVGWIIRLLVSVRWLLQTHESSILPWSLARRITRSQPSGWTGRRAGLVTKRPDSVRWLYSSSGRPIIIDDGDNNNWIPNNAWQRRRHWINQQRLTCTNIVLARQFSIIRTRKISH